MDNKFISKNNLLDLLNKLRDKIYTKEEVISLIEDITTIELSENELDEILEKFNNLLYITPEIQKLLSYKGIKTSRLDNNKSGFILSNDQDISDIFLKFTDIQNPVITGSGNVISDLVINTNNNKLNINYSKTNILPITYCSYCSYCSYCNSYCSNCYCDQCIVQCSPCHCNCCSG